MKLEHNSISWFVVSLVGRDKWTEIGEKVRLIDLTEIEENSTNLSA